MAMSSQVSRTDFLGNGATASYSTTFPVKATTELRVFTQDADGQDVELALGADYSAVLGTTGLCTITLTAGNLANGYKLSLQRGIPYTQTVSPGAAYNATAMAVALDRLAMELVRVKGDLDRALKVQYLDPGGDDVTRLLGNAASRANQSLVFDPDGNLAVGSGSGGGDLTPKAANLALLGPNSGAAAIPSFRAITKEDTRAALLAALVAGTNVTITDNGDGTYTFAAVGGSSGIGGSIAANQVAYGSGTDAIAGSSLATFNGTDFILGSGTTFKSRGPVAFGAGATTNADYDLMLNGTYTGGAAVYRGLCVDSIHTLATGSASTGIDVSYSTGGALNGDHIVGVQVRPAHRGSGTLNNLYGIFSAPTVAIGSGAVTNSYSAYIEAPYHEGGGGTIANSYGVKIVDVTTGTTTNLSLDVDGKARFSKTSGANTYATSDVKIAGTVGINEQLLVPLVNLSAAGNNKAIICMNSGGTNFGQINVKAGSPGAWGLGYANTTTGAIGTTVLTWDENNTVQIATDPGGSDKLRVGGGITINSATLMSTKTSFTNGAGASAGTLTNAPAVGNPTKWIPVDDNGTTRYIPAW